LNKKVLYTAICGKWDNLPILKEIPKGWDYVCFTSEDLEPCEPWQIIHTHRMYNDPRDSRIYKINPHVFLSKYDVSVWMDGNIQLNKGWEKVVNDSLSKSDLTFLRHPNAVKGAYHEGRRCINMKKDTEKNILPQLAFYQSEGLPDNEPTAATGILIRRHNKLEKFLRLWWKQVHKYSFRDQIGLPYARWKTKVKYEEIHFDRNGWFSLVGHKARAKK